MPFEQGHEGGKGNSRAWVLPEPGAEWAWLKSSRSSLWLGSEE